MTDLKPSYFIDLFKDATALLKGVKNPQGFGMYDRMIKVLDEDANKGNYGDVILRIETIGDDYETAKELCNSYVQKIKSLIHPNDLSDLEQKLSGITQEVNTCGLLSTFLAV
jgi:hypothetical protein